MTSPSTVRRATTARRWWPCLVLLCLLAVVGVPSSASAHAELLSTNPEDGATLAEAPEQVELTFSENVSPVEGGTRLLVPGDEPVVLDTTARDAVVSAALPELPDDTRVVVSWRVVSSDGHPISGLLTFDVGTPAAGDAPVVEEAVLDAAAPSWVPASLTVATALWYVGLLLLAGSSFFAVSCRPGTSRGGPRRPEVVVTGGAAVAALATIPLQAWRVAGEVVPDVAQWAYLAGSRQVVAGLVSAVLLPLVVALVRRPPVAAGVAAAALVTPVLTGHSASQAPAWLVVGADVVHLAAGAVWLGGVVALVGFLRSTRSDAAAADTASAVVRRFSVLAASSVVALAVTGTVMAWIVLPSFDALLTTPYGRLLVVKVALAAVPVGIAAWNRSHLGPGHGPDRLLRVVRREASLLVAVVLATGALVLQSPTGHDHDPAGASAASSDAEASPTREVEGRADGVVVRATVDPVGRAGTTDLRLDLRDDSGAPLELVEPPTLDVSLPDQDIGPSRTSARADDDGYTATLPTPVPGTWQVVVGVRLSEFEQRSVLLRVVVG